MFRSIFEANLDAKGRLAIPVKFREDPLISDSDGKMVVTADRSKCLLLYPLSDWERIEQQLAGLSSLNSTAVKLKRFILGYATDVDLDVQGRILLPSQLREFAGLQKKIVLSGLTNKIEIWHKESWAGTQNDWLTANLGDEDQDIINSVVL
ncbi:MAG: division/cell wall cluster transcriptional repressor MraZ [Methylococcaceae bacterium]